MTGEYAYVVDDTVLEFFDSRRKGEREELLRVFRSLAADPYQRGEWLQKSASGQELQVKRFGRWLVTFWRDAPVLELRIVDVKKVIP
jgi:hypothetical protein